jgi:glycine cleavage system H protein
MNVPGDIKYTREHEWVRAESGVATAGITDFAQDQLGDIVYVQLPEPGAQVEQMARMGEIESVKSVSDLFAPLSGEVVERNAAVEGQPELVNQDPYGDGWLVKLRLSDETQVGSLLSAEEYAALIEQPQ